MTEYMPWIVIAAAVIALIVTALLWRAHYVSSD